ncbi:MAG: hypothetical protein OD918_06365 [Gammaproteobacteria bacterium]
MKPTKSANFREWLMNCSAHTHTHTHTDATVPTGSQCCYNATSVGQDGHEICFVGDEAFRELSKEDPEADRLLSQVSIQFETAATLVLVLHSADLSTVSAITKTVKGCWLRNVTLIVTYSAGLLVGRVEAGAVSVCVEPLCVFCVCIAVQAMDEDKSDEWFAKKAKRMKHQQDEQ